MKLTTSRRGITFAIIATAVAGAGWGVAGEARAQGVPSEVRIGFQKGSAVLVLARKQQVIEDAPESAGRPQRQVGRIPVRPADAGGHGRRRRRPRIGRRHAADLRASWRLPTGLRGGHAIGPAWGTGPAELRHPDAGRPEGQAGRVRQGLERAQRRDQGARPRRPDHQGRGAGLPVAGRRDGSVQRRQGRRLGGLGPVLRGSPRRTTALASSPTPPIDAWRAPPTTWPPATLRTSTRRCWRPSSTRSANLPHGQDGTATSWRPSPAPRPASTRRPGPRRSPAPTSRSARSRRPTSHSSSNWRTHSRRWASSRARSTSPRWSGKHRTSHPRRLSGPTLRPPPRTACGCRPGTAGRADARAAEKTPRAGRAPAPCPGP